MREQLALGDNFEVSPCNIIVKVIYISMISLQVGAACH